jgi:NifB/MoaA-like Fe-S oxidoreductase
MLKWHRRVGNEMRRRLGTRFVWLSDEWYCLSGKRVPSRRHYEGFPQLEDGVGTTRLFLDDLERTRSRLPTESPHPIVGTLVTGEASQGAVGNLRDTLNAVGGVRVGLLAVRNRWFGGTIGVAGLLTASDITAALVQAGLRGKVWLPNVCLSRESGAFLDDVMPHEVAAATQCEVEAVPPLPSALVAAMGLTPSGPMG